MQNIHVIHNIECQCTSQVTRNVGEREKESCRCENVEIVRVSEGF